MSNAVIDQINEDRAFWDAAEVAQGGEDVVLPPQKGIAVYISTTGHLCIRGQSRDDLEEPDTIITIPLASAGRVVRAMQQKIREARRSRS